MVSEDLADLDPEDFSDALVEALVPVEEQTDDVALLVIRYDGATATGGSTSVRHRHLGR